jgi:hypothetical protein
VISLSLIDPPYVGVRRREQHLAKPARGASIMSILFAKLESSLFTQIAMFSGAGLSLSLALAFAYDLQIPAQWL